MSIIVKGKEILRLVQETQNLELKQKILELQGEILEIYEENLKLKEQNQGLNKALKLKQNLIFENNRYFLLNENREKEGPFCSKCFDGQDRLIRLHFHPSENFCFCPVCNCSA